MHDILEEYGYNDDKSKMNERMTNMKQIPKPQEIYRHFKGNLYQIVTIAIHSETREPMVVYQAMYGDYKVFVRPLDMFISEVDHEKYPEVTQKLRFERIQEIIPYELEEEIPAPADKSGEKKAAADEEKITEANAEEVLDPAVLAFLDAESYKQKLELLDGLRHRITNEMLTTMALACDIEVKEGSPEERFAELRSCLQTLEKYECSRLR